jgi:hypothetical protein
MSPSPLSFDYLDFVLPAFVRIAWTSDTARQVWLPRFQAVIRACVKTELMASAFGVRKCALMLISDKDLPELEPFWQSRGLTALKLKLQPGTTLPAPSQYAVGSAQDVKTFEEACNTQNPHYIGELLGYPACCRDSFQKHCIAEKLLDPIFTMADTGLHSSNAKPVFEVSGPIFTNVFWKPIGIRAVPHLPCRFDCDATCSWGQSFLQATAELGFHDELSWLRQILSWPAEWSALHGIAEIKTPILKISTRTDATSHKLVVRRLGDHYPAEGAQGLCFPYQTPQNTMTESPAFQRGLRQIET